MSDHTELVKRLRSIRWTGMVEAADAIEELRDELLQSTEATRYVAIQRDGLSTRLEAEVRARHVFMGWQQGWCPTSIGAACACEWTGRVPVGARSETEAEAEYAAHVAEAVAEALGGQP